MVGDPSLIDDVPRAILGSGVRFAQTLLSVSHAASTLTCRCGQPTDTAPRRGGSRQLRLADYMVAAVKEWGSEDVLCNALSGHDGE